MSKPKHPHWISLQGQIQPLPTGFKYLPTPVGAPTTAPTTTSIPYCFAKSDVWFTSGTIAYKVKLNAKEDTAQIVLNHPANNQIFVGLGGAGAYTIVRWENSQWTPINVAGTFDILNLEKSYKVEIRVSGSQVSLFVNGVEACNAANATVQKSQLAMFVRSQAPIDITDVTIVAQRPKAFVVMQFTEVFNALFKEVIKPVCEEYGYDCIRADNIYTNELIINDVIRSIKDAAIVIADITPNNPNVFYEVGFSHALGKETILLSDRERDDKLPFDVSGFRTLFYDNTIGGKPVVEERLRAHLKAINTIP